jgi:transposase
MAGPLSEDLRRRVIDAVEREGMSRRKAATRFGIAAKTAITWVAEYRATGRTRALPMGGTKEAKLTPHRELFLKMIKEHPDWSIESYRHALSEQGIVVGYGSIRRFFAREKITRKKRLSMRANKTART